MPYKAKGQCVYKADTGKKVGCTKGPVSKYLAALHANVPDAKNESKTTNTMKPEPLKKVVQLLAKKVEDFQNYVGIDDPHDFTFDTLEQEIADIKNPKIKKFWNSLSEKQQTSIYNMVTQYLYNKAIKQNPDYYDDKPQAINYNLPKKAKQAGPAPTGDKLNKVIQHLANKAEEWKNYEGLDSPDEITYVDFLNFVVDDPKTSPAVKKFWYSLNRGKQDQIFNKVIDVLHKKYGSDDDDMYENINLSKMAEKVVEANKPAPLMLNGKEVERGSLEVDGMDPKDYPDFSDAYISGGNYVDGTPLSDQEIEQLEKENYGLANDLAHGNLF